MSSHEHIAVLQSQLPTVGEQFDKYTLLAKLATGGMAELFVAQLSGAAGFSKNVVIKRILPHVAHDENFTQMFLDEALTCAQITHPNVCQVFELCEANGSHFLVLEHLEGATVGDLIQRCIDANQQVNLRLAAGIIVQACDGLQAAHDQVDSGGKSIGLVHRDVSPANLFVTVDGIIKVLDFGIAKAGWMSRKTRTGTLLGKCEYMSPEQARGGVPVDRRSDIFSLGITAWELLCGRRLFRRETEYDTLKAVLRAPIESPRSLRPTVPEALDRAIMCALERDRDDRFRTAYEFRKAIASSLRSVGGPTPMCDIAPVIRKSFAEELRVQRAVLREAAKLSTEIQTKQPTVAKEEVIHSADLLRETRSSSGTLPERSPEAGTEVDIHNAETEINPPRTENFSQELATVNQAPPRVVIPSPSRLDTEKRRDDTRVGTTVVVILFSACIAAAVTFFVVKLTNQNDVRPAQTPRQAPHAALKAQAVVTSIVEEPADTGQMPPLGTLAITSTRPAQIYLYPEKKLLGETPLFNIQLPSGLHKLKAEIADGQKKYFEIKIESGKTSNRRLGHWRK